MNDFKSRFQEWRDEENQLHREDGPAIQCRNGDKFWYKHGKLHREGLPAIEWATGTKSWYQNGKPHHREDGPAVECADGRKYWWYEGEQLPPYVQSVEQLKSYLKNKILW